MDGNVKGDKAILEEALERFKRARDAEADNRKEALDDIRFLWNEDNCQWPESARKVRGDRPVLTENRLPQFVRQIVNAQRQNRPSINVAPVDSQGDPAVAEVFEGMIRHIEQISKADLAYDTAFESAVTGGFGYFRISTRYVPDEGENQEIAILPIENAFSVYDDPDYQLPDGSDRNWCFVTEWVRRDDFKAKYGKEPSPWESGGSGDDENLWEEEDKVQVAEYWRKREGKVEQFVLTRDKILSRSEWAGTMIPIIPVFGEVRNIAGEKLRKGLIRDTKDLARVNNYFLSAEVEAVALQPKAPFVGPTGAFETDEVKWATANQANHAYLQYDPVEGAPPPMRAEPPQFPAAFRETRLGAIEGMKAIMGIYDASLGARSNETSGVAIEARAAQGDLATYHYIDNMVRAIRYAGTVVIELMPKIYDAPRVVRIIAPDGQAAMVAVNQAFIDPRSMQQREFNLASGRYDVVVRAGPSYQTQRQEASQKIAELVKAFPPIAQVAGDLLFKNLDFPEADKIAERMKPQTELPPQIQQQMQQMQQQLQQMGQQMQQMQAMLQQKDLDLARKELEKEQKDLAIAVERAKSQLKDQAASMAPGDGSDALQMQKQSAKQEIALAIKDMEKKQLELSLAEQQLAFREAKCSEEEQRLRLSEPEPDLDENGEPMPEPEPEPSMRDVLQTLVQALTAPKRVVRGPDGRAIGVESIIH